jgi:hypothetical protein
VGSIIIAADRHSLLPALTGGAATLETLETPDVSGSV